MTLIRRDKGEALRPNSTLDQSAKNRSQLQLCIRITCGAFKMCPCLGPHPRGCDHSQGRDSPEQRKNRGHKLSLRELPEQGWKGRFQKEANFTEVEGKQRKCNMAESKGRENFQKEQVAKTVANCCLDVNYDSSKTIPGSQQVLNR